MKFVVFVEGDLEKRVLSAFLRQWLNSKTTRRVGVHVIRFQGVNQFTKKVPVAARRHLEGPGQSDIIAAIGMLDLYGVDYYPQHLSSAKERHEWLCQMFREKVNHTKFRMFCAVHEVEAWILSQPEFLPAKCRRALPGTVQRPESINFDEPPSKLLQKLYNQKLPRRYKKIVDGTNLFAKLDPAIVRNRCPYLKSMLDEMLNMATEVGC